MILMESKNLKPNIEPDFEDIFDFNSQTNPVFKPQKDPYKNKIIENPTIDTHKNEKLSDLEIFLEDTTSILKIKKQEKHNHLQKIKQVKSESNIYKNFQTTYDFDNKGNYIHFINDDDTLEGICLKYDVSV